MFQGNHSFVPGNGNADGRYKVVEMVPRSSNNSTSYAPVFVFTDAAGKEHKIYSSVSSNPPSHHVGETVRVLYDPAAPESARIDAFFSLWLFPLVFSGIGALDFIIGVIFYIVGRRKPSLAVES